MKYQRIANEHSGVATIFVWILQSMAVASLTLMALLAGMAQCITIAAVPWPEMWFVQVLYMIPGVICLIMIYKTWIVINDDWAKY
jgi:hypothetical protein